MAASEGSVAGNFVQRGIRLAGIQPVGHVGGDVSIGDLLFATPPFAFLGIPTLFTEEVCVVTEDGNPGGGTFNAHSYGKTATFDVDINTIALLGNEALAAASS